MTTEVPKITRDMLDDAVVIGITVEEARSYSDGKDLNEVIPVWDETLDKAQGDAAIQDAPQLIIIMVLPDAK